MNNTHRNVIIDFEYVECLTIFDNASNKNILIIATLREMLALFSRKGKEGKGREGGTRWYCVKTTPAAFMRSSLEDSPMTLIYSRLTSPRNSKGNIESEGGE